MKWTAIQTALAAQGFDPGPIDGIPGRRTIGALKKFQAAEGLLADGIPGPMTWAAFETAGGVHVSHEPDDGDAMEAPWMAVLAGKMGWDEETDHRKVADFLKSDGSTVGDPAKLPWCGDLVETCIALTLPEERMVANPYLARNWMKFGEEDDQGHVGSVAVYWRTDKVHSSNGHVGFAIGRRKSDGAIRTRGGNQNNRISDTWMPADRLLGFRRPTTWTQPLAPLPLMEADGGLSTSEA